MHDAGQQDSPQLLKTVPSAPPRHPPLGRELEPGTGCTKCREDKNIQAASQWDFVAVVSSSQNDWEMRQSWPWQGERRGLGKL